jgi:hypothetical protein
MLQRIDTADGAAAISVLVGVLALFLPWYGYALGTSHVTVNGFRASILGVVFLLALGTIALLLLVRGGVIDEQPPSAQQERTIANAVAAVAAAVVVLQFGLNLVAGGRSIGVGVLFAVLSAAGLVTSARLRSREYTPRFSRLSS